MKQQYWARSGARPLVMPLSVVLVIALGAVAAHLALAADVAAQGDAGEPAGAPKHRAPFEGKDWMLVAYLTRTVAGDVPITARFMDGRVSGNTGASEYFAVYEARGERLTIKRIGTTRNTADAQAMEQERAYLALLGAADTYRVIGRCLEIRNKQGTLMLIYRASSRFWRGAEAIRSPLDAYETRGHVMVPFRPIAEWLGATVKYEAGARTVEATSGEGTVTLTAGNREAMVNDEKVLLPLRPTDGRGQMFVPFEFIREAFGVKVHWFPGDQVALIRDGARKGALYPGDYWHGVIAETKHD